jgi:hypothetical protein
MLIAYLVGFLLFYCVMELLSIGKLIEAFNPLGKDIIHEDSKHGMAYLTI